MGRESYLRGGEKYNTQITGDAIRKVADILDAADNHVPSTVYPEMYGHEDMHEIALGWTWAAVLIADMTDADSRTLRSLADAINGIYNEEVST